MNNKNNFNRIYNKNIIESFENTIFFTKHKILK